MERAGTSLDQRPSWRADELVDLILYKRERWWPRDLPLTVTAGDDGDWMVVSKERTARPWEPELARSIGQAVGEIRSRNAWNGY